MDTSESKLQRKIIKDLIKKGFVPVKNMVVNKPGWPDITVHVPGKQEFFIEVKKEGKDLGPLQDLRKDELKEIGKKVFKVDSWEAYEQIYKKQ